MKKKIQFLTIYCDNLLFSHGFGTTNKMASFQKKKEKNET